MRETTAPSTVLRCRRPSTPICSGATPIMETTTFTSTPTLPDSGTPHGKGQTGHPVYHARLQRAVPYPRWRPHPHCSGGDPRPHLPVIDETHFENQRRERPLSYLRICRAFGANGKRDPAAFFSAGAVFQCIALIRGADSSDQGRKRIQPLPRVFGGGRRRKSQICRGQQWKKRRYQSTGGRHAGRLHVWLADPRRRSKNYDEQGQPIKPRQKDRGEAR